MIDFDKIAEDFEKNKYEAKQEALQNQFKSEYNCPFVLEAEGHMRQFNYNLGEYFRKLNQLLKKISAIDILSIDHKNEELTGWKHEMDISLREDVEDFYGFCVRSLSDGYFYSGVIERAISEYQEVSSDFEKDMEKFCFDEYISGGTIKEAIRKFVGDYQSNRFITKSLDTIGSLVIATEKNKLEIWERV